MGKFQRKIVLAIVATVVLGGAGVILAKTPNGPRPKNTNIQISANAKKNLTMSGTVVSVGRNGYSMTLKTAGGKNVSVNMGTKTNFLNRRGNRINASSLKTGDRVTVSGQASQMSGSTVTSMSATTVKDMSR